MLCPAYIVTPESGECNQKQSHRQQQPLPVFFHLLPCETEYQENSNYDYIDGHSEKRTINTRISPIGLRPILKTQMYYFFAQ